MTNYYRNVEHGDINLYSYMVRKDIRTHLALGGIPNRLNHLREGNLPIILDWIESREGLPTYFHCFTMISLHCQRLLYHCTFKEMKKLIEVICEQIEVLESNKLIPRKLDPSKKRPAWYRQNSVFIKIVSKKNFRYEIYDTSQFF